MHLVPLFQSIQCNLLLFDYSGYGKSGGKPSQSQLYHDVSSVLHYSQEIFQYPLHRIILYGESIGCPVAAYAATIYQVPNLILQSGPASILQYCYHKFPAWIYCFLYPMVFRDFPTSSYLNSYSGRCLIIHGNNDSLIPVHHAEILHQTKKNVIVSSTLKHLKD